MIASLLARAALWRAALACAALLFASSARAAQAPQPIDHSLITVNARRVEYFSNRAIISARGDVRISAPDGLVVTGDAFAMDLRLERFVVVGHVVLQTPAGRIAGAGLADFLPFRRIYFVPLEPSADRWTFLNGDFAHPEKGRIMPGDVFFLPDLSEERPFVIARRVDIDASSYARYGALRFVLLGGSIQTPPLPSYVDNFSANPNFGVNSLSGTSFDAPYNFAGSAHSLDAIHFRYDTQLGTYGAFEHHSVFNATDYLVFSLNPATQPAKQWNVLGYRQFDPNSALTIETQLFTYQSGLSQPLSANGFADVQFVHALRESSVRFETTPQYGNLLAPNSLGYYGSPAHTYTPNHPWTWGLLWSGFDQPLGKGGFTYRLSSGLGFDYDSLGVSRSSAAKNAWSHYLEVLLGSPAVPGPLHTSLSGTLDLRRTWLSFPNVVDQQTLIGTVSRRLSPSLYMVGSAVVASVHTDSLTNTIVSPNRSTGLTPQPDSNDGYPLVGGVGIYPGQLGATNRAYGVLISWQPSASMQAALSFAQNTYSPVQVPFGPGPPRYQASADVRFRLSRTLFADISRAYFFNWGNQLWSPRFGLQISAQ